ncbi:hypothetical protein [Herbiconiux sp. L3-i23]|uniref:hypothetical protein n=1 Tax=Herbiconiux sp. L3-i23 TaxID=2905871 RepID=UPI00205CE0DE|nr:hypothetical protein L3i23_09400 [Herbiconiux sp. L3-i23]
MRETSAPAAGAAYLADYVNDIRGINPNTLFISGGDNIGASTFESAVQNDTPTLDALNAMGLAVSAVGNHEFDKGFADLRDRVIGQNGSGEADFPYIGANVFRAGTDEHAIAPSHVTTVAGVRVGFVGAVTEQMPTLVSPSGIQGLEFRDTVESVNAEAAILQDGDETNGEADVVSLSSMRAPPPPRSPTRATTRSSARSPPG